MKNYRLHGPAPYQLAVIHGGPGAAGSLQSLAHTLAKQTGVLEPMQTMDSVAKQIDELKNVLDAHAQLPMTLLGHSWGAMLSYLFAATHPDYVKKLILVGSGVFAAEYAEDIMSTRLKRLSAEQQTELNQLMDQLNQEEDKADRAFQQIGKLLEQADLYDPVQIDDNTQAIPGQYHIYQSVWPEVAKLRASGELLVEGQNITCPVIIIHGEYDPHPYQGVHEPLSKVIADLTFFKLEKCGHEPWLEKYAQDEFYKIIHQQLK